MKERTTYAVFCQMIPTDYDPHPQWRQYGDWVELFGFAKLQLDSCRKNSRFAEVKIVKRVETFEDVESEETP